MEYISGPVVAGQHFLEAMTRLMRMWEHIDTVWHNELNKKRNKSTPSPFYSLMVHLQLEFTRASPDRFPA